MHSMNKIGVFCASSDKMDSIYYEEAAKLGEWIGKNNHTLVYGGANCGLMEVVAKATKENGGTVYGVVPQKLVRDNRVSDYIDITFHCNDLSDRKQWLIDESEIMIVMPGSVGTLDEAFCALAANTFGLHNKKVVFWNINGFYDLLIHFMDSLTDQGVVNKPWPQLMEVATSFEELIKIIK